MIIINYYSQFVAVFTELPPNDRKPRHCTKTKQKCLNVETSFGLNMIWINLSHYRTSCYIIFYTKPDLCANTLSPNHKHCWTWLEQVRLSILAVDRKQTEEDRLQKEKSNTIVFQVVNKLISTSEPFLVQTQVLLSTLPLIDTEEKNTDIV